MAGQRSEITDDDTHEWISFDLDGETYTFDATWLTSNWKCIYGDGCLGIEEEPDEGSMLGCCSHGAHFADKEDRKRVAEVFPRLRDDEWQFKEVAASLGGPIREWKRRDWGEGGADFHWWCTEDPRAFVGDVPVYVSSKDEIVALVGQGAYDRVVELIEQRGTQVFLPHPSVKRAPASSD